MSDDEGDFENVSFDGQTEIVVNQSDVCVGIFHFYSDGFNRSNYIGYLPEKFT